MWSEDKKVACMFQAFSDIIAGQLLFLRLTNLEDDGKVGEVWAIKLSADGQYLAGTTHDGHIKVWDIQNGAEQIRDFETKGSFGTCIDIVCSPGILRVGVLPLL